MGGRYREAELVLCNSLNQDFKKVKQPSDGMRPTEVMSLLHQGYSRRVGNH